MIINSKWKEVTSLIQYVGKCPHCDNRAPQTLQYTYLVEIEDEDQEINPERVYFMFTCETCKELLLYQADVPSEDLEYRHEFDEEDFFQPINLEHYESSQLFQLVWPTVEQQDPFQE